ncbi:MAG: FHA domain-containing protein, partial [Planctomycetota bacterium]
MARLVIRDQGKERVYRIEENIVSIGRVQDNHIVIKDPRSSRKHCQLVKTEKGYKIVDLKSRNGILVNGKPVKEALLRDGDKISI